MVVQQAKKLSLNELPQIDEDELIEERGRGKPDLKKHSLLVSSNSMGSLNSITSMYSASFGKGDYDITGEVEIGVWYKEGQLFVRVVRAKGLAAAKKGGVSDPYIKTYLLPDRGKRSKRKTGVQRKTTNPVFNEILKVRFIHACVDNCCGFKNGRFISKIVLCVCFSLGPEPSNQAQCFVCAVLLLLLKLYPVLLEFPHCLSKEYN